MSPHCRDVISQIPFVVICSTCLVQLGRHRLSLLGSLRRCYCSFSSKEEPFSAPCISFSFFCALISVVVHSKLENGHLYQSYAAIMAKVEVF